MRVCAHHNFLDIVAIISSPQPAPLTAIPSYSFRHCVYHTRCCFIHFEGATGPLSLAQDLLDTPSSAHIEGIHRGKSSTLPRLRAEIQAARAMTVITSPSLTTAGPAPPAAWGPQARDNFERYGFGRLQMRLVAQLGDKVYSPKYGACCVVNRMHLF